MYIIVTVIRVCCILLTPINLFRVVKLCGSMLTRCMSCLGGYVLDETYNNMGLRYFLYSSVIIYSTSRRLWAADKEKVKNVVGKP